MVDRKVNSCPGNHLKANSPLLVLDLGLYVIDGVGGLHLEGDGLAGKSLHEDLHSCLQLSTCKPGSGRYTGWRTHVVKVWLWWVVRAMVVVGEQGAAVAGGPYQGRRQQLTQRMCGSPFRPSPSHRLIVAQVIRNSLIAQCIVYSGTILWRYGRMRTQPTTSASIVLTSKRW